MEFPPFLILLAVFTGAPLAAIQVRRIIRGELSFWGIRSILDASTIQLDRFDKIMMLTSGLSFTGLVILLVVRAG